MLISVESSLALSDCNLGTVLGAIAVNVQDETRIVDVGDKAVLEEPVLVASILLK